MEMDVLQSKIIQQIEVYLTEENLRNDYNLAKYERDNDGWIPVERLNQFNKLSTYKYETIANALHSKRSNIIELNFSEPLHIRRRREPFSEPTLEENPYFEQTVVISGLPRDAKQEELIEFFNRFYPVDHLRMLFSARTNNSFTGKIHLIFQRSEDARAFVQRSESMTIIYVNDYVLQLCNGYTLVCKMLADCDDKNENDIIEQTDRSRFQNGKSFSHRLNNNSPRVTFNTNVCLNKIDLKKIPAQNKSCLKSSTCATEQILFCQNTTPSKHSKAFEYRNQPIVFNRFTYEYYIPTHLLKQTCACMIITALNPHCFTIQLKEDAIEFDKFQREINEFYNEVNTKEYRVTSEQIQLNLCVICADPKSSSNDVIWNRSQILDYDPIDQTVNLFYVDLGTWDEYVPIDRLRHLIDYFHRHLVFSLTCRLAHVSPCNEQDEDIMWPDDATEQFLAVIDQVIPEIELLQFDHDRAFQTNLFVINSGQYICVNDYMIHIKKAKPIVQVMKDDNQHVIQLDSLTSNSMIHPVIALFNQLGECLKQSRSTRKILVKLIHLTPEINDIIQQELPLIFISYQQRIFIPDFNICTLLQPIHLHVNTEIIQKHALARQYEFVHITRQSQSDIFAQIDSLIRLHSSDNLILYTIDFVRAILEYYHFPNPGVFHALKQATFPFDLPVEYTTNNESLSISKKCLEDEQIVSMKKRLPFSNRIISPP